MANIDVQDKDEWVEAIVKLIELTQKKRLEWRAIPVEGVPLRGYRAERVVAAFQADHIGRKLLLSRRSYELNHNSFGYDVQRKLERAFQLHNSHSTGGNLRDSTVLLEFVNDDFNPLYTAPRTEATNQLFKEVEFQHSDNGANVREYLDELLKVG